MGTMDAGRTKQTARKNVSLLKQKIEKYKMLRTQAEQLVESGDLGLAVFYRRPTITNPSGIKICFFINSMDAAGRAKRITRADGFFFDQMIHEYVKARMKERGLWPTNKKPTNSTTLFKETPVDPVIVVAQQEKKKKHYKKDLFISNQSQKNAYSKAPNFKKHSGGSDKQHFQRQQGCYQGASR